MYHSACVCLERNRLFRYQYFALKIDPVYPPQSFVSCGAEGMRTFFLVFYIATLSVSSLV